MWSSTSDERPYPLMPIALDVPLSRAELHLRTHLLTEQMRASVVQENRRLKRLSLGSRSPKGNEVLMAQVQLLRKELNESKCKEQVVAEEMKKVLVDSRHWQQQAMELQAEVEKLSLQHQKEAAAGLATASAVPEQQKQELEQELAHFLKEANFRKPEGKQASEPLQARLAVDRGAGSNFPNLNVVFSHVWRGLICFRFSECGDGGSS